MDPFKEGFLATADLAGQQFHTNSSKLRVDFTDFLNCTTIIKHVPIKHLVFFSSYLEILTFQINFTKYKTKTNDTLFQ